MGYYDFKYKKNQKVLLRVNAEHRHQREFWKAIDGEQWAVILEPYISSHQGGRWYRIRAASGYTNSYPEEDLEPFGFESNKEAKQLLSEEW